MDAALSPTKGPKVASLTLSSASYTERHPGRGDNPAVRVSIRWKATGKVKRGFERERSEYGLFLRTTAQRPAKATLTIEAGPYTVTGTATDAGIWQSVYTQL